MIRVAGWLERAEDALYAIAGIMLAAVSLVILIHAAFAFFTDLNELGAATATLHLLEEVLLALMAVELLYTVIVSLRTRSLSPEPFLVVGLVAAIRRILAVSVEAAELVEGDPDQFRLAIIEIGMLIVGVMILVFSIWILRRCRPAPNPCAVDDAAPQSEVSDESCTSTP
ncbi:MAG: hypothetical protein GF330_03630 [Candidatus Eisenbacteria bacterium]|nr:hypothetical protein [Candidatus Eisenbacteria bacterium]